MKYVKTIQNNNFCNGKAIDVYYNDIDEKYHCDFTGTQFYGTLGVFNDASNDIYMLDVIDKFINRIG